jgi:hypothetical protein
MTQPALSLIPASRSERVGGLVFSVICQTPLRWVFHAIRAGISAANDQLFIDDLVLSISFESRKASIAKSPDDDRCEPEIRVPAIFFGAP